MLKIEVTLYGIALNNRRIELETVALSGPIAKHKLLGVTAEEAKRKLLNALVVSKDFDKFGRGYELSYFPQETEYSSLTALFGGTKKRKAAATEMRRLVTKLIDNCEEAIADYEALRSLPIEAEDCSNG
jgi:hypothetical protein